MFSGLESPMHLLVVLIIAILVLGPKKLPEAARGLGTGIRQFKDSIEGKETPAASVAPAPVVAPAPPVVAEAEKTE
jgi:sec-independent protein translocase protein TatA